MVNKYSFQGFDKEHMVCSRGTSLSISTKQTIEISAFLKGRPVLKAQDFLQRVIKQEMAVPYRRFNADVGHKPGMGPGRYPIKACSEILKVLNSAIANAQFKGMNPTDMILRHMCAQKAAGQWHYGRQTRRQMKRTHVEIVLEEVAKKDLKDKKPAKKPVKKEAAKEETKKPEPQKAAEKKEDKPKAAETEVKKEVKAEKTENKADESKKKTEKEVKPEATEKKKEETDNQTKKQTGEKE